MTASRIYLVADEEDTNNVRLVRATNPASALRHVTRTRFRAVVADQDALVAALKAGVEPETAGDAE